MANYLDTGDTGRAVSAETDGALFAGIFGNAKYVLGNGSQFKAEVQSNNIVKISDGDAVMYGRHVRIPANDSALVTINNGHSGTNRIDLIVFRYTKDSTGKETVDLAVIQGEDSTGTAAAPATIDGDILTGAMQADFPLYRVELNGLNIVSVTAMFDVIGNISQLTKTNKDLSNKVAELNKNITSVKSVNKNITKMIAGSKVVNAKASTSVQVFTNSEINKALGVTNSSNANTVVLMTNGDGLAQKVHVEGSTYLDGAWHATFNQNASSGSIRINYVIFYFGK
jgi:hypothetical protein